MKEFELSIDLVMDDYTDYNLTFYNKLSRATELFLFWFFPFLFFIIAVGMLLDPDVKNKSAVIVVVIFMGLSFLLSKLMIYIRRKIHPVYIRALSKRKYKNAQKSALIKINESGIESKGELTTFFCVWKQIVKLMENENAIYIFINRYVAFIIPKRFFDTIEELNEIKTFIGHRSGKDFRFVHLNKKTTS